MLKNITRTVALAAVLATGGTIAVAPAHAVSSTTTQNTISQENQQGSAASSYSAFKDISKSPFRNDITWMDYAGISNGWKHSDGTRSYRPYDPVHRWDMAAFLYRLADSPPYTPPKVSPFKDVPTTHVFYKEMAWMESTGIANGWSDGTYRPSNTVQRWTMAAFLYRFAGSPAYTAPAVSPFKDIKPGDPFYKEMSWMNSAGVANGWSDGTYRPNAVVSREIMAAFLHRMETKGLKPVANGEVRRSGFITGYTYHSTGGSTAIAHSSAWNPDTIHHTVGGVGTYEDPITLATDPKIYKPGTRFYLPHVKRYFIVEDTCGACGGKYDRIDMWLGGTKADKESDTLKCAYSVTGTYDFIVNPKKGYPVNSGSIFNSATDTCATVSK